MISRHFLDWGSTQLRWKGGPQANSGTSAGVFREPNYSLERFSDQAVLAVGTTAGHYVGRVPSSAQLYQPFLAGLPADIGVAGRAGLAVLSQLGWVESWWKSWTQTRKLVWAIPTQTTPVERGWFEQLSQVWGYRQLDLVPQSLAAANFWTGGRPTETALWVMDIGAEKTELAVVQGGTLLVGQTIQFGMSALITAVQQSVTQTQRVEISFAVARQVLQTIGTLSEQAGDQRELAVMGKSLETQLPVVVTVKAGLLQPYLVAALEPLAAELAVFIAALPATALTESMQHGIALSGGGAKFNGLSQWLQMRYQVTCQVAKQPEMVMLEGLIKTFQHDILV